MRIRQVVFASICGALYATVGMLTYLGIFAPVFGVVRFWPAVIVPGFFTLSFGPQVGALGAALGIFISDLLIHGDALLSITIGVPSNLLGFYLMGVIGRKKGMRSGLLRLLTALGALASFALIDYFYFSLVAGSPTVYDIAAALALGLLVSIPFLWGYFKGDEALLRYALASNVGLLLGSIYIGTGIWLYSQVLSLPPGVMGGQSKLPIAAAVFLALWTYSTEIPFLLIVVPPLIRAMPKSLVPGEVT